MLPESSRIQPPDEDDAFDLKGRPMYYIPWAISDADEAAAGMETYLDQSIDFYLDSLLDPSDRLVWDVFHAILDYSHSQRPVSHIKITTWFILTTRRSNSSMKS